MNHLEDRPLATGEVLSPHHVLAAFALSDEVASIVAPRLEELARSIPSLRTWRGLSEGAWVMGARTAADTRRTTRADFSRVEFAVRVDAARRSVHAACRRTQRGRDQATERMAEVLDELGRDRFTAWVEGMLLGFAACWYERTV